MNRSLLTCAVAAVMVVTAANPAAAQDPQGILETGCFPTASTTVSPDKTTAEAKLAVVCKLAGVELIKFVFTHKLKGKDCTEPTLSHGQGSGTASLEAETSATCKLDDTGKGAVTFGQSIEAPGGLALANLNNTFDIAGKPEAELTSGTESGVNASADPLPPLEWSYNGNYNGNANYGSLNGNNNGNYNWGSSNSVDSEGHGSGDLQYNTNGNNNVGNYNGNFNGNYNY